MGSQLFTAYGPQAVRELASLGFDVFLDLKFHDIPNTVAGAVAAAAKLPGVRMLTLHTCGGMPMLRAARSAIERRANRPKLIGITILTSLRTPDLRRMGIQRSVRDGAVKLATLAKEAGLDGVVASAGEVRAIRRACGKRWLIVVPGIRPSGAGRQDQSRVATPGAAIRGGADYLVVGRPIAEAPDPRRAAEDILKEIAAALSSVR